MPVSSVSELSIKFGYMDPLKPFEGQPAASDEYMGRLSLLSTLVFYLSEVDVSQQSGTVTTTAEHRLSDGSLKFQEVAVDDGPRTLPFERSLIFSVDDPQKRDKPRIFDINFGLQDRTPGGKTYDIAMFAEVEDHGPAKSADTDPKIILLSRPLVRRTLEVVNPLIEVLESAKAAS